MCIKKCKVLFSDTTSAYLFKWTVFAEMSKFSVHNVRVLLANTTKYTTKLIKDSPLSHETREPASRLRDKVQGGYKNGRRWQLIKFDSVLNYNSGGTLSLHPLFWPLFSLEFLCSSVSTIFFFLFQNNEANSRPCSLKRDISAGTLSL